MIAADPRQGTLLPDSSSPPVLGDPAGAPHRPAVPCGGPVFLTLPSLLQRRHARRAAESPLGPARPNPDAVDSMKASQGGTYSSPNRGGGPAQPVEGHPPHSLALAAVLDLRRHHHDDRGHTPATDDARDLLDFSKGAGRHLRDMNESASLHRLDMTRRYAVKLAAYALALAESCDRRLAALPQATSQQQEQSLA